MYFGTNQALYKVDRNGNYRLIKNSEGQIWSINVIGNTLFSSGDNGIMVITPSESYKINLQGAWETHPLAGDKDKLIVATYSGFCILKRSNAHWIYSHKVPEFMDSSRGFIEDDEAYTFWIANANGQIQRITFDPEFRKVTKRKIYPLDSTAFNANIIFRKIDNNLVICTRRGILQHSRITDSFDHYTQLESMLEGEKYYEYLMTDRFKNIWFVADNNLKMLHYSDGGYKEAIYNWGLSSELIDSYENVYMTDTNTAVVSVDNAFVKIDLSKKDEESRPVNTYIRKITNNRNDSILSYENNGKILSLPYMLNSIRIHFAATCYEHSSDVLYTFRLNGADDEWSMPSPNTMKEYTNLREGKYTFEVKAFIDGHPDSADITSISFTVQPPWYRSLLAWLLYTFVVAILILILYRKTISKQKKIIHQKGEELIAQSRRHKEETKLKDQEIYELQNENLKNELKYKTQELNGYILNVIRKNEMLEDVKKNALSISKAIDEEKQMTTVRQRVMRLISQVDSNIEHDTDFKVFESNFDLIHQDFFKLLDERFPGLSRNDKILCAYLNMNLSTKEIAPLLNISVRGVEVNRYRLRKKMNLDRDVNLSEFLHILR
jgi:DNA-binding CsgD family transcriptional regulator